MMINRAYKRTPSTEVFFFNLRQIKLLGNQSKFKKNEELFRFRSNLPAGLKEDLQYYDKKYIGVSSLYLGSPVVATSGTTLQMKY